MAEARAALLLCPHLLFPARALTDAALLLRETCRHAQLMGRREPGGLWRSHSGPSASQGTSAKESICWPAAAVMSVCPAPGSTAVMIACPAAAVAPTSTVCPAACSRARWPGLQVLLSRLLPWAPFPHLPACPLSPGNPVPLPWALTATARTLGSHSNFS